MYQAARFSLLRAKRIAVETDPISTDPNVKLLLHANGANGSTVILDHSQSQRTLTVNGAAQISTAQKKFGSGSLLVASASDYVTIPTTTDLDFPNNVDWTWDCWVRITDAGGTKAVYTARPGTGDVPYLNISLQQVQWLNGAIALSSTTNLALNAFHHLAITKSGSTYRLFVNGVKESEATDATTNHTNANSRVGGSFGAMHVDEFRLLKGSAAWTANFTPPAVPYT